MIRRRMVNSIAASSFVLFVVTTVLWVRSYRSPELFVAGYWDRRPHPAYPGYRIGTFLRVAHCDGEILIWLGSSGCLDGPGDTRGHRALVIPYRVASLHLAVLSAPLLLVAARRRPSAKSPICRVCRYNLTGNISGICPECGTRIAAEAAV